VSASTSSTDANAIASKSFEIHRTKGRIPLDDGKVKLIQGVREIYEIFDEDKVDASKKSEDQAACGKIVLIGYGLDERSFQASLDSALATLSKVQTRV
jgi:G3E family GTPase